MCSSQTTRTARRFLTRWRLAWCAVIAQACASFISAQPAASMSSWQPLTWHGERAYAASSGGWLAIVSAERGRLVHFGPDASLNLLFTPSRRDAFTWGGHRVWLGPQTAWDDFWPPPAAWEAGAADAVHASGPTLELALPPTDDGWPRIHRSYTWTGPRLRCEVRCEGGRRAAQVIQIFQFPPNVRVTAEAVSAPGTPHGFVQLPLGRRPGLQRIFNVPEHARVDGAKVELRLRGEDEKLGFQPQTLIAHHPAGYRVSVGRGEFTGAASDVPDDGFVSQVYLGWSGSPLIELEQLFPRFAPSAAATVFTVTLEAERLPSGDFPPPASG